MASPLNLFARPARPAAPAPVQKAAPSAGVQAADAGLIKDGTDATFADDVINASQQVPVVIDLWAPWCGPCKTLGPIIEKVVREAKGAVRLVKINVDENPQLSRQLRVQSIPAVYAFKGGKPVDGFVGPLPESQVRAFIQGLTGEQGPAIAEEIFAEAQAAREAGDLGAAAALYGELAKMEPTNVGALASLAQVYLDSGDAERAHQTLQLVPPDKASDAAVRAVEAAISLRANAKPKSETLALEAKVGANPADHQARFDLAVAQAADDRRAEAVDNLLEIVRHQRGWNDDAARQAARDVVRSMGAER